MRERERHTLKEEEREIERKKTERKKTERKSYHFYYLMFRLILGEVDDPDVDLSDLSDRSEDKFLTMATAPTTPILFKTFFPEEICFRTTM